MGTFVWLAIAAAVILGGAMAYALRVHWTRRDTSPALRLTRATAHPVGNERGDWYARCAVEFQNPAGQPVLIIGVDVWAESADRQRMKPQRVCGCKREAIKNRDHPPHIMMCLPISMPPLGKADYTFDVFFGREFRALLPGGKLCMTVQTEAGDSSSADIPLTEWG